MTKQFSVPDAIGEDINMMVEEQHGNDENPVQ